MLSQPHGYNNQSLLMRFITKRKVKNDLVSLLIEKHQVNVQYQGNNKELINMMDNVIHLMVSIWLESISSIDAAVTKFIGLCDSIESSRNDLITLFNQKNIQGKTPINVINEALLNINDENSISTRVVQHQDSQPLLD